MAEIRTYPYLTVDSSHIVVTENWHYSDGAEDIELENILHHWDATSVLIAEIALKLDLKQILQDCGLGTDAMLRLVIGWRSSGTMLRGHGTRIDLTSSNTKQSMKLKVQISGTEVAHDIGLFVALILVSAGKNPHKLSASVPGSVLWINENHLTLNDAGLYFPIEVIDFAAREWKVPLKSAWYLEWDPFDLDQTVFGDIQLYLNSAHPTVLNALSSSETLSDIFQQVLFFDVARMLILGGLSNPDFMQDPTQYPEGSIGFAIYNLLCEYFPDETVETLLEKRNDKNLFEAMLQHHLSFLKIQR